MNQQLTHIEKTTAAAADGNSFDTVAVLEQLLIQSIRLRDLHANARWQISGSAFSEIRKMLNDHHKNSSVSLIYLSIAYASWAALPVYSPAIFFSAPSSAG